MTKMLAKLIQYINYIMDCGCEAGGGGGGEASKLMIGPF